MHINLENKIALVTGATRGIGRAIAESLARAGADVIGTGTTNEGAKAITQWFETENLTGCGAMLDVSDRDKVREFTNNLEADKRMPAILVNNAGITRDNLLLRMDDEEWDDVISTDLSSVFHLSKACLRNMMRARWGRIINIGSVVGSSGHAGQVNYCAAKAGLMGFTKALAQEMGSRKVTVNLVAPGFIGTDMTAVLPDDIREGLLSQIALKRLGEPEEIANVVSFLASDAAAYITGQTIHVNGGLYM